MELRLHWKKKMAIETAVYADFEMENGDRCRIEKTEKGYFHIHIGNTLYVFTPEEFQEYSSAVVKARSKLISMKRGEK